MAFQYQSPLTDKIIETPKVWRDANGNPTRFGWRPDMVVLHIMEGSLSGTDAWFQNPTAGGSSTYGVGKSGAVHQYACESWAPKANSNANKSTARLVLERGSVNPNFYTISIEHEGFTGNPWPDALFIKSAQLTADICKRWNIPVDRDHIVGHYEIDAVNRPRCPGTGLTTRWSEYINKVKSFYTPVEHPPVTPTPDQYRVVEEDTTNNTQTQTFYTGTERNKADTAFENAKAAIKFPNLVLMYKNSTLIKVYEAVETPVVTPPPVNPPPVTPPSENLLEQFLEFIRGLFK